MIDRAEEMQISWPLDFGMTDALLDGLLFPSEESATTLVPVTVKISDKVVKIIQSYVGIVNKMVWRKEI